MNLIPGNRYTVILINALAMTTMIEFEVVNTPGPGRAQVKQRGKRKITEPRFEWDSTLVFEGWDLKMVTDLDFVASNRNGGIARGDANINLVGDAAYYRSMIDAHNLNSGFDHHDRVFAFSEAEILDTSNHGEGTPVYPGKQEHGEQSAEERAEGDAAELTTDQQLAALEAEEAALMEQLAELKGVGAKPPPPSQEHAAIDSEVRQRALCSSEPAPTSTREVAQAFVAGGRGAVLPDAPWSFPASPNVKFAENEEKDGYELSFPGPIKGAVLKSLSDGKPKWKFHFGKKCWYTKRCLEARWAINTIVAAFDADPDAFLVHPRAAEPPSAAPQTIQPSTPLILI